MIRHLALCLSIFCVSHVALAKPLEFSSHVYHAIEKFHSKEFGKYRDAVQILFQAKELSTTLVARQNVEEAISLLHAGDRDVASALQHLQKALRAERLQFNRSYESELELIEKLVAYNALGSAANQVRLRYSGISKEEALPLLLLYVIDPRSAEYDVDVSALVKGQTPDGTPSEYSIAFKLPDQEFALPPGSDAKEIKLAVQQDLRSLISQQIPLRAKAKLVNHSLVVSMEIVGFQNAPFVESWVRNVLVWGNGNRYVFYTANGLEASSRWLRTLYVGGSPSVQNILTKAAEKIESVEDVLRSKLVSTRWHTATPDTIKKMIESEEKSKIAHMEKNLAREIEALNSRTDLSEAARAKMNGELGERTNKWIANANQRLASRIGSVDKAIAELEATEAFKKASLKAKADMRANVAMKNGKKWMPTFDQALKAVSVGLALYYVAEAGIQMARTESTDFQLQIAEHYGVKAANALLYAFPTVGELAIIVDLGSAAANYGLEKAGVDLQIPDIEKGMHWLIDSAKELNYRRQGTSSFQIKLTQLYKALEIPVLLQKEQGVWASPEIVAYARSQTVEDPNKPSGAVQKLSADLKELAGRYVSLVALLNNEFPGSKSEEFGEFEGILYKKLLDEKFGYFPNAWAVLK